MVPQRNRVHEINLVSISAGSPIRGIDESGNSFVSEFDYLRLDHKKGDTDPFKLQGGNNTQIRPREVRVLLTEEEIRWITQLVFYIERFIQWRKQKVGLSTQSVPSKISTNIKTSNC